MRDRFLWNDMQRKVLKPVEARLPGYSAIHHYLKFDMAYTFIHMSAYLESSYWEHEDASLKASCNSIGVRRGIRSVLFLDAPGYPSCGFQRGFTSIAVFRCSLMTAGVPVKIPVTFRRITRWEDLNLRRYSFSPVERRIHEAREQEQHKFCPFLSNEVDKSQTVLLPVLLSFSGGRFGALFVVSC